MNMNNIKKYGKYMVALAVIILLFSVGYFINNNESKEKNISSDDKMEESVETIYDASEHKSVAEEINTSSPIMKVEIKGAVMSPGVYEIEDGDRVEDIVKKSGGFQKDADTIRIQLAHKLQDEEIVYVYKNGEKENIDLQGVQNITASTGNKSSSVASKSNKININVATKEELMKLPGVGQVKADAIIQYREENGAFKTVEDLQNVSGIGEKTLSKFIQLVDTK